jgi:hypothetical protein
MPFAWLETKLICQNLKQLIAEMLFFSNDKHFEILGCELIIS